MKPINLAKCKIGQRVRLKSGHIAQITEYDELVAQKRSLLLWRASNGFYYTADGITGGNVNPQRDIIAILPLPKKKAKTATHMGKPVDISQNRRSIKATIQNLKNAIKHLEGLIQP